MDDAMVAGTVNERLARGKALAHANLASAGFKPVNNDWGRDAAADSANYNGGIAGKREGRIQKGDVLFRFSDSSRRSRDAQCSGLWWFDLECFLTIRHASRMANTPFATTARTLLGVLFDWGDMRNLIGGEVTADFWCYKGLSNGFSGTSRKGDVQNMSGPVRQDVIQLFIPGGLTRAHLTDVYYDVLKSKLLP